MVGAISVKTRVTTLPVVETFHSVQGEGYWTGSSAFFIRLAGCDVGCPWCDTKHSWPMDRHPHRAIDDLVAEAIAAQPFMVVITGGEPLMHDLTGLTRSLHRSGLRIHLETSGSHPLSGDFDWISLSPKRFKPPLANIYAQAHELKVVIATASDLQWAEEMAQQVTRHQVTRQMAHPGHVIKLLQPCWGIGSETLRQTLPQTLPQKDRPQQLVFDYVLQHSEWRVGLQTHKFLGVR